MNNSLTALTVLLSCFVINAKAGSILDGLTVHAIWFDPCLSCVYKDAGTAVVGAGLEFPSSDWVGNTAMRIDLSDTANTITFDGADNGACCQFLSDSFNGFDISVVSPFAGFTGVTVESSSAAWAGLDPSRLSFDATDIYLNMEGLITGPPSEIVLGYSAAGVAPEPGTLGLLGVSLAGLLVAVRRRASC